MESQKSGASIAGGVLDDSRDFQPRGPGLGIEAFAGERRGRCIDQGLGPLPPATPLRRHGESDACSLACNHGKPLELGLTAPPIHGREGQSGVRWAPRFVRSALPPDPAASDFWPKPKLSP